MKIMKNVKIGESVLKNEKNVKKGVTLMVLVITIILILILSSAIIITLSFSDPVGDANEAVLKTDIQAMKDSYQILYNDLLFDNLGDERKLKDSDFEKIVPDTYKDEFKASKDGIEYIGEDEKIKEIAEEMGLGKNNTNQLEDVVVQANVTSIDIEAITKGDNTVDEYVYYIRKAGEKEWIEYTSEENKIQIDGLKEDTKYEVMVEVVNGEEREESSIIEVRTKKLEAGKLVMKLNDINGENYIEGIWTKENVYIKSEGENTTYTATGVNEVEKTEGEVVLRNEGETKVILETKEGVSVVRKEYTVRIDKTAPEGKIQKEVKPKSGSVSDVVVGAVDVTDNLSGIREYEYYLDGVQKAISKESIYTFEGISNGSHELKIVIVDNARNKKEVITNVDLGIPDANDDSKVNLNKEPSSWTNENVKLKFNFIVEDAYTPQYSEDGVTWVDVTKECEKEVEENKKVYIRFVYHGETDIIGKVKEITIDNIDKELPEISSLTASSSEITNENITLTGKAIDTLSGIVAYMFSTSDTETATSSGWVSVPNSKEEIVQEYEVKENGTYYFYVKDEAGNVIKKEIVIENIDNTAPTKEKPTVASNTNSITATFRQVDDLEIDSSTIKYAIKKTTDSTWGDWITSNTGSYTFSNLKMDESYDIKTMVSDTAGNTSESEVATIKTVNISKPNITAPTEWTKGDVLVTITYPNIEGTTKQYSTDGANWTDTIQEVQVVPVTENNVTVYARIIDSTNQTGGNATHKVENIDKLAPKNFTPTGVAELKSIKVTADTTDEANATNGASGIKSYRFSKDDGATWTTSQTSNVYTFTELNSNTTYNVKVEVTDNVGNIMVSERLVIKTIEPVAKIGTVEYETIQKAFDAVPNSTQTTVTLLKSTTEDATLATSKNAIFDMDSKTVTGTITSNGAIEVKNGNIDGQLKLTGKNTDTLTNVNITSESMETCLTIGLNGVETLNQPTVNIRGGNFKTYRNAIVTYGTVTIDGNPKMENEIGVSLIYNEPNATLTIKNGTYLAPNYACVKNLGTANIQGGTYTMTQALPSDGSYYAALVNDVNAKMNITAGTITSSQAGVINNGTNCTISGTTKITSSGHNALMNLSGATATVTGGTFESNYNTIYNLGTITVSGATIVKSTNGDCAPIYNVKNAEVKGGTFTGEHSSIYNSGTITMSAGTYNNNSVSYSLINNDTNGTMSVTGGTYNGSFINRGTKLTISGTPQIKITDTSFNGAIIENYSNAEIKAGTFSSTAGGIWNKPNGTMIVSGGTFTSTMVNFRNDGTTLNISGSPQFTCTASTHCSASYAGTVNISGGTFKKTVDSNKGYAYLLNNNANSKINISGGTFDSVEMAVYNYNGTLTVSGTANIRSSSSSQPTISNAANGTFNMNGGTVYSTKYSSIITAGTFKMTAGTVSNGSSTYYALRKSGGTATVTGGSVSSKNF